MSTPDYIPGTDGWTPDDWARNDPHTLPSAAEPATYGEYTWDDYSAAYQRAQAERKQRERWALQVEGE